MERAEEAEDISDITGGESAPVFYIINIYFYIINFIFENPLPQ